MPSDGQRLFERIDSLVKADARLNRIIPDFLGGTVRSVFDCLEQQPVTVEVRLAPGQNYRVTVGKLDAQVVTALLSGNVEFIRAVPSLYYAMSQGDFSLMGLLLANLKLRDIGTAMTYTMHCASGYSEERQARIEEEKKTSILGDAINYPFSHPGICGS